MAVRAAREVLLRRLFVSAAALHPEHGTSEATLEEAEVKLALADVAAEVVVAIDSSKLGQRAPARGLAPERAALLVTELDPADARLDPYRERWEIR
jgi:DeoR family fructose operon transcriptional repressor